MADGEEAGRLGLRSALLELANEAMHKAARTPLGSQEHDFYWGVASAAETRLRPARAAADDPAWLDRQPSAFRDGFLQASALIASAMVRSHHHLLLPVFPGSATTRSGAGDGERAG